MAIQNLARDGVYSIDFGVEQARQLFDAQRTDGELGARWRRIREDIRFLDVVAELHGTASTTISCPFHGLDSKPSFVIYERTNDAYCFGCPEGEKYYDAVRFTAAKLGMRHLRAIEWLESEYGLPPLEMDEEDAEDDEETIRVRLTHADLCPEYRAMAAEAFRNCGNPALIREYIRIYFNAALAEGEAGTETETTKALALASVLGRGRIESLKKRKFEL
jgi:hypothetical protein